MKKMIIFTVAILVGMSYASNAQVALEWAKGIGGQGFNQGISIAVDAFGNVFSTGYFSDTADFDPGPDIYNLSSAGESDVFILKQDADGNFLWAINMGGADGEFADKIALDDLGNIYITGLFKDTADFDPGPDTFAHFSAGDFDVFITKLDSFGNLIWSKAFGGASPDYGLSLALDDLGNVYVSGYFEGTADFDPGLDSFILSATQSKDVYISKLDVNGDFVWAKSFDGGPMNDLGYSITADAAGNVFMTGNYMGTVDFDPGLDTFNLTAVAARDIYIVKLNTDGEFVWAKSMGGTNHDKGNSIVLDAFGNIYTTGYFRGVADFDPGIDTFLLPYRGYNDIFISKLDSDGNFISASSIGGPGMVFSLSMAVDASGNVYTTGFFMGGVDFDPGPDTLIFGAVFRSAFILKTDANGNYVWAGNIGNDYQTKSQSIAIDAIGNIYTTGFFERTTDFDPGIGVFNLTSVGNNDIFVCKLSSFNVGVYEPSLLPTIHLFPNPTSGLITLEINEPSKISVYNTVGALVFQSEAAQGSSQHDLSFLANGVYYVKVLNGGGAAMQKLVISH